MPFLENAPSLQEKFFTIATLAERLREAWDNFAVFVESKNHDSLITFDSHLLKPGLSILIQILAEEMRNSSLKVQDQMANPGEVHGLLENSEEFCRILDFGSVPYKKNEQVSKPSSPTFLGGASSPPQPVDDDDVPF